MQLPQIQINHQNARIGLENNFAQISIRQSHADMRISQPHADLSMSTRHAQIYIDQRQAWDEVELKHIFTKITEYAQKGRQAALQAASRAAQEGDRMREIHISSNPFVEFAKRDQGQIPNTGIKFIPSYGSVKISYQPMETDIQAQARDVQVDVNINKPQIQFNPGQSRAYLAQKNQIHFNVIGEMFSQGL
ncbi:DUF6470 family protein [Desulfuribacillus alkaliarsenatis]|uniref:Uncharacterized protein n=1 Tax=Desulfuribacillus alkaliarsenatis TaxID=766136 RepID=A0A1E5G3P4_9FIRM|nr:DUF6470 family protein [Desulfuribacillus alkaliarsenatis]OEF97708.1 hypothetical protein BHF68_14005 [Desulfuribacillus alkaliarsenatis]